jgi:hypothetical protein
VPGIALKYFHMSFSAASSLRAGAAGRCFFFTGLLSSTSDVAIGPVDRQNL